MAHPAGEETIQVVKEIFRSYLKEHNQRQTPERFMVLEDIYRADGHFDADDIYYERAYAYQQHDHIICQECGGVLEFCDPRIQEIQSMMEKMFDFDISGHSLHFFGACNDPENCEEKAKIEAEEEQEKQKQEKK